jgi:hypothetical protein
VQDHIVVIRHRLVPGADWLDEACWRCGSHDGTLDHAGRRLCGPCRTALSLSPADDADPVHVSRRGYWETHALQCCWRCMAGAVRPDDEVGLCGSCRAALAPA